MNVAKLTAGLLAFTFATTSALATPATEKACFDAAATGQKLRKVGKLKEADEKFLRCAEANCPGEVVTDCTKWHTEVTALLPSVTLSAKNGEGKDLIDVRVFLDGTSVASQLDGKAIVADPGVHEFRFEVSGEPPITERVVLNEGEKVRKVSVRFGSKNTNEDDKKGDDRKGDAGTKPLPIGAFIVGGVGLAAVGVGAALYLTGAADYPADCTRAADGKGGTCLNPENNTRGQEADNRMIAGQWTMLGGGIVFLGGLAWFIVDRVTPTSKKSKESRYAPVFSPTSVQIRF
jgi:hypothetical protein